MSSHRRSAPACWVAVATVVTLAAGLAPATAAEAPAEDRQRPRDRITIEDVESARVPEGVCGLDAGRFVDGSFSPPNLTGGRIWIADDARTRRAVAFGAVRPGDRDGAAVAVSCMQGTRRWADRVLIYDEDLKVVGNVVAGHRHHESRSRSIVRRVEIRGGRVHVEVVGRKTRSDNDGRRRGAADMRLGWSAKRERVVVERRRLYSAQRVTARLLLAAEQGRTGYLRSNATPKVAARLVRLAREGGIAHHDPTNSAVSLLDCAWESTRRTRAAGADGVCLFDQYADDSHTYRSRDVATWRIWLRKTGWRTWRAIGLQRPAWDRRAHERRR